MEATKTPTRDYPSFTDNNWGLWETIYGRRSSRKYLPMAFDAGLAGKLSKLLPLPVRFAEPDRKALWSRLIQTGRSA